MRPKISHFWSPKESSYSWERRREKGRIEKGEEEEEEKEKRTSRVSKGMELYGSYNFVWAFGFVWNTKGFYGF